MTASAVPRMPAPTITTSDSLCSVRRTVAGEGSMAEGGGEGEGEESRIRGIAEKRGFAEETEEMNVQSIVDAGMLGIVRDK